MEVRPANINDIPRLIMWSRDMFKESRYREQEIDIDSVIATYKHIMMSETGIFLIHKHGFFCGGVKKYWFSKSKGSTDMLLYVEPEHRGGTAAKKLVEKYIEYAKNLGISNSDIHIGSGTEIDPDRTEKFYINCGFKKIGGNFVLGD